MKHIVKTSEPQEFTDWKNLENDDWKPCYGNFQNPEKEIVFKSLIAEQGGICCYCESELVENDYHIEHIVPQNDNTGDSSLDLEYTNMLCSCQRNNKPETPIHCGNAKDDWYDEQLFISPLEADCESSFAFKPNGEIEPREDGNARAVETINRLKLDEPSLNAKRRDTIAPFLDESISHEDNALFVQHYLTRKENGHFNEFWTTINYLFGATAAQNV